MLQIFKEIKQDFNRGNDRTEYLETKEFGTYDALHATQHFLNAVALTDGAEYTSADAREDGVPSYAKGIACTIEMATINSSYYLYMGRGDDTLDAFNQYLRWLGAADTNRQMMTQFALIPLAADGTFKLKPVGASPTVTLTVCGYWT